MHLPLCAATLIPLNKKDGGIRPIAVGETLRRGAGKLLLRIPQVQREMDCLRPRQCGVGVPFASELVGMGVQRLAEGQLPDVVRDAWCLLQVDLRNAFNCIDRTAVLRAALSKVPSIYNWLKWTYAVSSPLFCQGKQLASSKTGVHQGDTMASVAFALGLDVALDACLTEENELPWSTWFLDDGTLLGPLDSICAYLDTLVPSLPRLAVRFFYYKKHVFFK